VTPGIQELMRAVERVRDAYRSAVLMGDLSTALSLCAPDITVVR
jgi:hypothetical protein